MFSAQGFQTPIPPPRSAFTSMNSRLLLAWPVAFLACLASEINSLLAFYRLDCGGSLHAGSVAFPQGNLQKAKQSSKEELTKRQEQTKNQPRSSVPTTISWSGTAAPARRYRKIRGCDKLTQEPSSNPPGRPSNINRVFPTVSTRCQPNSPFRQASSTQNIYAELQTIALSVAFLWLVCSFSDSVAIR